MNLFDFFLARANDYNFVYSKNQKTKDRSMSCLQFLSFSLSPKFCINLLLQENNKCLFRKTRQAVHSSKEQWPGALYPKLFKIIQNHSRL